METKKEKLGLLMPNALRVFKALRACGLTDDQALVIADVVEASRAPGAAFPAEQIMDNICDAGVEELLAEAMCIALRCTYASERSKVHFDRTAIKVGLVRAKFSAPYADRFLDALAPAVATLAKREVRAPVKHDPSPGRVVMCDFTFLQKPEMLKERRAIVISARGSSQTGRCTVVPVSMTPCRDTNPLYFEFPAASHVFFHAQNPVWAVCDHVYTVSLARLWQININKKPSIPSILPAELEAIRKLCGTHVGLKD